MKALFYSTKDFEQGYQGKANERHFDIGFTDKALSVDEARLAEGMIASPCLQAMMFPHRLLTNYIKAA